MPKPLNRSGRCESHCDPGICPATAAAAARDQRRHGREGSPPPPTPFATDLTRTKLPPRPREGVVRGW